MAESLNEIAACLQNRARDAEQIADVIPHPGNFASTFTSADVDTYLDRYALR
jgi:hypothetical protein